MKKSFLVIILLLVSVFCFSDTLKFDADGNIYFEYGNKRFKDKERVDSKTFNQIRIFDAIKHNDWNTVKKEINSGIDINSSVYLVLNDNAVQEYSVLIFAINEGQENIANKLIEKGADINKICYTYYNGEEIETTVLSSACMNFSSFSEEFIISIIEDVDDILTSSQMSIGFCCSDKICKAAMDKYFLLHQSETDRENFVANLLYGIILSEYCNGNVAINDRAVPCIMSLFSEEWFISNRTFIVNL